MTVHHLFDREDWYVISVNHASPGEPTWSHGKHVLTGPKIEASVAYKFFGKGHGVAVRFGRNGMESDCGLDVFLGPLASFWLRLRSPWTKWLKVRDQDSPGWYHPRHTGIQLGWFRGHIVTVEWDSADNGGRDLRRDWSLHGWQILGRTTVDRTEIESGAVRVPLPEGNYDATYTTEQAIRRHVRYPGKILDWFGRKSWVTTTVDVPGGIPVCGMDGIFSSSGPGRVEQAVGSLVASIQRGRNRFGGPHNLTKPTTVSEAGA